MYHTNTVIIDTNDISQHIIKRYKCILKIAFSRLAFLTNYTETNRAIRQQQLTQNWLVTWKLYKFCYVLLY
jgi:hypothetical protein